VSKDNKETTGKLRLHTVPWLAIEEIAKVCEHGTDKYGPHNYLTPTNQQNYWDAAMRHLLAIVAGQRTDPDSGLLHSAHVAATMMMFCSQEISGLATETSLGTKILELLRRENEETL
jgi:hypothetical protein